MRRLPRPAQQVRDVFTLCIRSVRNQGLARRLREIAPEIIDGEALYIQKAEEETLHTFPRSPLVGGRVTADEMSDVYTGRFVPKRCDAREIYDQLISAAPHGRCPICGVGPVSTLDHHLPKAEYPVLSVTPTNLVPACYWCQTSKMKGYPTTAAEQTIHPYFDDFEGERWLRSEIDETQPATFSFHVQRPDGWSELAVARLERHLKAFKLDRLFAANAADELINIRYSLTELFVAGGAQVVRQHLEHEADSREHAIKNSWQTAMYRAAHESDWFCDGGFDQG